MSETRPTLVRAMLTGSLANLVVSAAVPVAAAYAGGVMRSGSPVSDLAVMLLLLIGAAALALFVIHEVVLLALTLLQRSKFATTTAGDLAATFVSWVMLIDVFLIFLGFLFLPEGNQGLLLGLAVLAAAGAYGAALYARRIAAAVELASAAEATEAGPAAPPVSPPKAPRMVGLRIYTTIVIAAPLLFGLGEHSWGTTFLVAIVSIGAGRVVEALALRLRER